MLLVAVPGRAAEIGRDTLLNADQAVQWRSIGRVNIVGRGRLRMCTGTLIRPDVVLTAAHCLVHLRTGKLRVPGTVHFVAGWHRGWRVGHAKARSIVVHPDWQNYDPKQSPRLGSDIGLIRLSEPLHHPSMRLFPVAPLVRRATYPLVGYRRDRPHALTSQPDCAFVRQRQTRLILRCSAIKGASGSPVFQLGPDGPEIVAVLSAGAPGKGQIELYTAMAHGAVGEMLKRLD